MTVQFVPNMNIYAVSRGKNKTINVLLQGRWFTVCDFTKENQDAETNEMLNERREMLGHTTDI